MFIKGNCATYIDKNLKVYENSTVLFVLWTELMFKRTIKHCRKYRETKTHLIHLFKWHILFAVCLKGVELFYSFFILNYHIIKQKIITEMFI